jgi:hypothetical protein
MQDYHFLYWSKKELKIKIYNMPTFPEEREERGWSRAFDEWAGGFPRMQRFSSTRVYPQWVQIRR